MRRITLLAVATTTAIILAVPAISVAAPRVVPPGNSGVNQYTETFPTAGGNAPLGSEGKRSPAQALGAKNARRLEALGPEGRAAAALAAATAPQGAGSEGGGDSARLNGEANASIPSGDSGFGEVLKQVTGSSDSGGMGLLLPLVIVAALAGSVGYALRRRRTA